MAYVALPTCGLAMAESERYLPDLITRIEEIMKETGLIINIPEYYVLISV